MSPAATHRYTWIQRASIVLYLVSAAILIHVNPGFQYDEALQVLGAAHLLHSSGPMPLPQDPDTWIEIGGRWLPLMTARYVGAVKEYTCWPLFEWFGPSVAVVRWVSALMGAIGIWGLSSLLFAFVSPAAGALVALLIAVHPGYLHNVVLDNGSIAGWMAALGLLCFAVAGYLSKATPARAFWIGCAMGFGVWARANYVWLLVALFLGAWIALGRRFRAPLTHVAWCIAGGLAGGSVLLLYQVISGGGTFAAIGMFQDPSPWGELIRKRWTMFREVLMLDRERRIIWGGGPTPLWQLIVFPALTLAACAICLKSRDVWKRASAAAFLILTAILFTSRMLVAEHHMAVLIPLAATIAVLAFGSPTSGSWKYLPAALLGIYLATAVYWQVTAIRGLGRTGGKGPWSDAVYLLNQQIQQRYANRRIDILDWGLQNNLFVLSGGRLRSREIFDNIAKDPAAASRFWQSQFESGGAYLINGPSNRQFPQATVGFLRALAEFHPAFSKSPVTDRSGAVYAELVDVKPLAETPSAPSSSMLSYLSTADPLAAGQLEGFHNVEQGWRWTMREFAVMLAAPGSGHGVRLALEGFVPEPALRQGSVTLKARIGDHDLAVETFARTGRFTLTRDVDAKWVQQGANRVSFTLDKAIAPTPADKRELGIIVSAVWMEPR
jgi:hypothetical protein